MPTAPPLPRTSTPCSAGCGCRTSAAAPEVLATARAQRWEPVEVLRALFTAEAAGRERSALATRRARAAFPTGKTFDAWKPEASSIPAPTQQALRTLEWLHRKENLVVCGPSGTGKTFLLEALGQHAVEQGLHVAWFTLEDLGGLIRRHRADDTVSKAISKILRADLVVVDDIGLLPVAADAAEGLYRLVDAAYEKRSVAISSNLHPAGFDELMPKTLATATVDRLLHHAHVCQTTGESCACPKPSPVKASPHSHDQQPQRPGQPAGQSHGHHRAELVATTGQVSWPPVGRSQWPLTRGLVWGIPSIRPGRRHRLVERSATALPAPVDDSSVIATLKDGILTINAPKRSDAKTTRVDIK